MSPVPRALAAAANNAAQTPATHALGAACWSCVFLDGDFDFPERLGVCGRGAAPPAEGVVMWAQLHSRRNRCQPDADGRPAAALTAFFCFVRAMRRGCFLGESPGDRCGRPLAGTVRLPRERQEAGLLCRNANCARDAARGEEGLLTFWRGKVFEFPCT